MFIICERELGYFIRRPFLVTRVLGEYFCETEDCYHDPVYSYIEMDTFSLPIDNTALRQPILGSASS